jgi:hypothetical protein
VLRLNYFAPSLANELDADGSHPSPSITTRDIPTGSLNPNLVGKVRLSYRMVAGPGTKVELGFGSTPWGAEWGAFNWAEAEWASFSGPFTALGEAIPVAKADPEGLFPKVWHPRRKVRYARLKITLSGPASIFSLRMLELFVRQDGRVI